MSSIRKPSPRFAEYVRKMLACGHWEVTGRQVFKENHSEIRHIQSGESLYYQTHDGGNSYNSERNFAADAQRMCGCEFVAARGRKRSRKRIETSGFVMPRESDAPAWICNAWRERDALAARLDAFRTTPDQSAVSEARRVIEDLSRIESNLRDAHQAPPVNGWSIPEIVNG